MKNLLLVAILLLGIASCTPVRYVMIDPKDSTKMVEVRKRVIYDDYYIQSPLFYNYWMNPMYRTPIIIQQPIRIPQRPVRPPVKHQQAPIRKFEPRRR
jgi:hypothetical protein